VASKGGTETRLATGAVAGPSSFHKVGTGIDVLAGEASSTTEASRTPRVNSAEGDDDEDLPLDDVAKIAAPGEQASNECGTLRMQRLWINFFFTILAVARLK
jgi:hypothetical protein